MKYIKDLFTKYPYKMYKKYYFFGVVGILIIGNWIF